MDELFLFNFNYKKKSVMTKKSLLTLVCLASFAQVSSKIELMSNQYMEFFKMEV